MNDGSGDILAYDLTSNSPTPSVQPPEFTVTGAANLLLQELDYLPRDSSTATLPPDVPTTIRAAPTEGLKG